MMVPEPVSCEASQKRIWSQIAWTDWPQVRPEVLHFGYPCLGRCFSGTMGRKMQASPGRWSLTWSWEAMISCVPK